MIIGMGFGELQEIADRLIGALESPNIADWITAGVAVGTLVVAVIALLYAKRQIDEARSARRQAKDLELERAQPYVVAYSEPSGATPVIIDFVVKNYGATAARDVRIEIDPWPVRTDGTPEGERMGIPDVIPVLAPGQEWRAMWDSGIQRKGSGHPDRHVGTVLYKGIDDADRSSELVLDWGVYKTRRWVEVYGAHDAAKALRDMRTIMKKWNESIHGGLAVYLRDADVRDEAERAEREEWLAQNDAARVADNSEEQSGGSRD